MTRTKFGLLSFVLAGAIASQTASASVTLLEKDGWAAKFSGFVEFDAIWDTTRTYNEVQGNAPVALPTSVSGMNGRGQFSLRNSRLAFGVEAPEVCSFHTKGYIESDFLGFDPSPSSTTSPAMSEASFYNNPTFRIRHAYLQADSGGFSLMIGQYWSLFGMQPYYFMPTLQVQPAAATLYLRVPQVRLMGNFKFDDTASLQLGVAAQRPPERDSLVPDFEGAIRFALDSWTSNFASSSSSPIKKMPLSLAVSGLVRDLSVPNPIAPGTPGPLTSQIGWAVAANAFLPIYSDLGITSEFSYGYGYGDQYNAFSGGLSSPATLTGGGTPAVTALLDTGIGGYDSAGNFQLVNLIVWNVAAQWHMPEWNTYLSAGAGQLYSPNMNLPIATTPGTAIGAGNYNRSLVIFGNLVHNFSDQIRSGVEYAYSETGYSVNTTTIGKNHRVQWTTTFTW